MKTLAHLSTETHSRTDSSSLIPCSDWRILSWEPLFSFKYHSIWWGILMGNRTTVTKLRGEEMYFFFLCSGKRKIIF